MRTYTFSPDASQSLKDHRIYREITCGVPISDLNPVHVTPKVLEKMAADSAGFRLIPENYLTDKLIVIGMRFFMARAAEIHASSDYKENYRLAALDRLASGRYLLAAFNYDLVDQKSRQTPSFR
jgi:hypothetical protein